MAATTIQPNLNTHNMCYCHDLPHELCDIKDRCWQEVLSKSEVVSIKSNTFVFTDNNPVDKFKILLTGTIRIYQIAENGSQVTLYRVQPGDVCLLSLFYIFDYKPQGVVAESETDASALVISISDYEMLMANCSKFRAYVLFRISERIFHLVKIINDTAFASLRERLANRLIHEFDSIKCDVIKKSHQAIANEFGVSRESVNRLLRKLELSGAIIIQRGNIKLLDRNLLQNFI